MKQLSINKELYCQFLIASQGRYSIAGLAELFANQPAHDIAPAKQIPCFLKTKFVI